MNKKPQFPIVNNNHWSGDLALCYLFKDTCHDYSGNGNDGTLSSATYCKFQPSQTGVIGLNLNNALSSYINCGSNQNITNMSQWTVVTNLNQTNYSSGVGYWCSKSAGWCLGIDGSYSFTHKLFAFDGTTSLSGNTVINNGTPYHIAGVFDGTNFQWFLNGIADSTPASFSPANDSGHNLWLGNRADVGNNNTQFVGQFDYVYIYPRALTAEQIWQLYQQPYLPVTPPKVYSFGVLNTNKTSGIVERRIYIPDAISDSPLNQGLVAWWLNVDGLTGGKTWYDLKKLNHGTLNNFTSNYGWSPKPSPGGKSSISFDGSSTYIQTPTFGLFDGTKDWTFSLWVNPTSISGYTMLYQTRGERDVAIDINGGGYYQVFWYSFTTTGPQSTNQAVVGQWTHLTAVWDTANSLLRLYINGIQNNTSSIGTPNTVSDINCFGSQYYSGSNHENFNGYLADARLWKRALSAAEVKALYEDSKGGYQQTLNRQQVMMPIVTSSTYNETGASGVLLDGTAIPAQIQSETGASGVLLDGNATPAQIQSETGASGVLLDGNATPAQIQFETGASGVLLDGNATVSSSSTSIEVGSGGVLLDGSATISQIEYETGASGVLLDGNATPAQIQSETGASGVLLDGTATPAQIQSETGASGVLLDGTAITEQIEVGSGGVLLDGSATISQIEYETGASGVLIAGTVNLAQAVIEGFGGVIVDGASIDNANYTISGNSGVLVAGSASDFVGSRQIYDEFGFGVGITNGTAINNEFIYLTGSGGVLLSGSATPLENNYYDPDVSIPFKISGSADAFISGTTAAGGITVSGSAEGKATYIYVTSGNNNYSPPNYSGISIGYRDYLNPTITSYSINEVYDFNWNVDGYSDVVIDFNWNVGESRRYWYRVVGKARSDGCPPISLGDSCCRQLVINVLARSTEDLCAQLQASGWQWPIDTVHRFTKPAENSAIIADASQGINYDCNVAVPVNLCENSACLDFCIDYDLRDVWHIRSFAQMNAFPSTEASGGITLSGKATTSFTQNFYSKTYNPTGGIQLSGSADVVSSDYTYMASGGIQLAGESTRVASNWLFVGGEWPTITNQLNGVNVTQFDESAGGISWTNINNALSSNDQYAECDLSSGNNSKFLVVYGFNPSLPSNINVLGIEAVIERHATASVKDLEIYLMLGNQIISKNMAPDINWPLGSDFASTIGGEFETWSDTPWDVNVLNNPLLGLAIKVQPITISPTTKLFVDNITLKFFYENQTNQRIRIQGEADVKSSHYEYIASGGIHLSNSELELKVNRITTDIGTGLIGPRYTSFTIGGTYSRGFTTEASGGVNLSGNADSISSAWEYQASGGLNLSGNSDFQSSNYHWVAESSGDPQIGGSATMLANYIFIPSGGLQFSGGYSTQGSHLEYYAEGGFNLSGSAEVISTNYTFYGNGGFQLGGTADQKESDLGLILTKMKADCFAMDVTFVFGNNISVDAFVPPTEIIQSCNCSSLSNLIPFKQNLTTQSNKLSQFLTRNNQTLNDILNLSYNSSNASWQNNIAYSGYAADTPAKESWQIVTDLQCTTSLGTELGQSIWKLGLKIVQKSLSTQKEYDTRIIVGFTPIACKNPADFRFTVTFNTQTGLASITPNATIYHNRIYDNIGLFKNQYWINNPELTLAISNTGFAIPVPRIPLVIT